MNSRSRERYPAKYSGVTATLKLRIFAAQGAFGDYAAIRQEVRKASRGFAGSSLFEAGEQIMFTAVRTDRSAATPHQGVALRRQYRLSNIVGQGEFAAGRRHR